MNAQRSRRYRAWEIILLLLASLIFAGSTYLYISDIPLRKYILGWDDGEDTAEQVGKLGVRNGSIQRQMRTHAEFKPVDTQAPLYNHDTIVTGPDSTATIQLDDGSTIELGPSTMVKLIFETRLSLQGIARTATVDVVTGQVASQSGGKDNVLLRSKNKEILLGKNARETLQVSLPARRTTPKPIVRPTIPPIAAAPSPSPSPEPSPVVVAAASPSPSPIPELKGKYIVKFVSPRAGERLSLDKFPRALERPVNLEWTITPPNTPVEVILRKRGAKADDQPLVKQIVKATGRRGSVRTVLKEPGSYEWEIRGPQGQQLTRFPLISRFSLNPEFEGIETMPPLVGGQVGANNRYRGELLDQFDITLQWKPYPGISKYQLQLKRNPGEAQSLLERAVTGTKYNFNKNKIYSGKVYYRIVSKVQNGFIATSTPAPFMFNFLPPALVIPENKASISIGNIYGDNSVLLTWQKTNFTDFYEVEVGADPQFQKSLIKKQSKENFFVIKGLPIGKYYWRVKSVAKDFSSAPSQPYELNLVK